MHKSHVPRVVRQRLVDGRQLVLPMMMTITTTTIGCQKQKHSNLIRTPLLLLLSGRYIYINSIELVYKFIYIYII